MLPDVDTSWPDDIGDAMQLFLDEAISVLGPLLDRIERPDAVLYDIGGFAGRVAAERWGVPAGQHSDGGYVACPTYPTYRYAWLRDGAFCAYALGLHDEHGSAATFHGFVSRTLLRYQGLFEVVTTAGVNGGTVPYMPRRATR